VTTFAMKTREYFPLFIVVGVRVFVNNIEVFNVAMEIKQWVPFALLSSYKIFHAAAKYFKD
jgi:hypothetical protein